MKQTREKLRELDKETLIDTVLLFQGRVSELERQVRELKKLTGFSPPADLPAKTPENSSIPSGQSRKAKKPPKLKRKQGAKTGHKGKNRQRSEADEVIECRVAVCCACGEDLSAVPQRRIGRRQVVDIPPLHPVVREARRYATTCPGCGKVQSAVYPLGFEKGRMFGEHLEQVVIYLHHAHPLSYQRVQHMFRELFGLQLSQGGLVNVVKRRQKTLDKAAESIRQQVKRAPVVGSDETGVRIAGENRWQWVFQTPEWVYLRMHRRRAAEVITGVMEEAQPLAWVSDLASAQLHHPAEQLQICLSHQARDLQYAVDAYRCVWAYRLQTLFYRAMRLVKWRDRIATGHYEAQIAAVERRLDELLNQYPHNPESQGLRRRYVKHRQNIFVFLYHQGVPPTNNASEQALRNSVIYRKVTGGFRTDWGADLYANSISILETARRQGRDFFDILTAILSDQPAFATISE